MDLIILVLGIALLGLLVWVIQTYIPMPPIFKTVIYIVCAIVLILFMAKQFAGTIPNVIK
jgi:hypothetical protein